MFGRYLEGFQPDVRYTRLTSIDTRDGYLVLCFDKRGTCIGHNHLWTKVEYVNHEALDGATVSITLDISKE